MSGPTPKPPTRVVVSGGPKVEPHLSQVPEPEQHGPSLALVVALLVGLVVLGLAIVLAPPLP
jgi:hypothetical protein